MQISDVAALALDRAKTLSLFERTEPKIVLSSSGDAARLAPAANSLVPICQRLRPAKNDIPWLAKNPMVTRCAIVDDQDEDDLPLFRPSSKTGITAEIATAIERYLDRDADENDGRNAIVRLGQRSTHH
jgi:hypothetical protein